MSSLDDLASDLIKKGMSNDDPARASLFLSTGFPVLDHRICGRYVKNAGLPMGRVVELFGPPSAGKTFIASQLMISAQKAGGIAIFMDHERSYDDRLAERLGLDLTFPRYIYKKPRTFEQSIDMVIALISAIREKKAIAPDAPICVIFDSLADMIPSSKIDKNHSDFNMHDNMALAKATGASMPGFALMCEEQNVLAVFLNHMKVKPGVTFGDPVTSPGGETFKFQCSVRIQLGAKKDQKDENARFISCKTVKNKVWRPHMTADWRLVFDEDGMVRPDVVSGCIEELKELKIIEQSGAYLIWTDGKKYHAGPLAQKIRDEDLYGELLSLFPEAEDE